MPLKPEIAVRATKNHSWLNLSKNLIVTQYKNVFVVVVSFQSKIRVPVTLKIRGTVSSRLFSLRAFDTTTSFYQQ